MSRRYLGTRWDLDNADCLCAGCHFYFTTHPVEFRLWLVEKMGREGFEALEQRALRIAKPDYEEIVDRLKKAA